MLISRVGTAALLFALPLAHAHAQALRMDTNGLKKGGVAPRYEVHKQQGAQKTETAPSRSRVATANSDVRVTVKSFRLTGVSLVPKPLLTKALEPFLGKPMGFVELQQAADTVTEIYRQKGFIASRAYLPQQMLSGEGKPADVEIAVVEGRYGRIRIENASRLPDSLIRDWLGVNTGEPVVLSTIERNLLLIEDLPGVRVVSSSFTPGDRLGESEYILAVESEPAVFGTATIDNYGLRNTGANRAGVDVSWQNPSGGADQLSGGILSSGQGLDSGRLTYSLPLNSRGWRGSLSFVRTSYRLGEELAVLNATGTADMVSVGATYPLVRERSLNAALALSIDSKRLRDEANGQLLANKHARSGSITLSGDEDGRMFAKGMTAWSGGLSFGRFDINNDEARAVDAAGPKTKGNFSRANLAIIHEETLLTPNDGWFMNLSLRAQYAPENLDPSEKMPLGGPTGIRAFPQGEGAGDRAVISSVELKKRMNWVSGYTLWTSLFYDMGRSVINAKPWDDQINRRSLKGYGIGLRADYSGKYFINSSIAWNSGEGSIDPAEKDKRPRIWVQAGAAY